MHNTQHGTHAKYSLAALSSADRVMTTVMLMPTLVIALARQ